MSDRFQVDADALETFEGESADLGEGIGELATALAAVRSAVVAGLPADEVLVAAAGLRPLATVDPTGETRRELFRRTKQASSPAARAAGALFRLNDRLSAWTDPGYDHDEPSRAEVDAARANVSGDANSAAVRLVRCWLDVPPRSTFLYLSDRRWLVTSTVTATGGRGSAPGSSPKSFRRAARDLGQIVTGTGDRASRGLPERTADGRPALIVAWSVSRPDVEVRQTDDVLRLTFPDASWLTLVPDARGAALDEQIARLAAAGVTLAG